MKTALTCTGLRQGLNEGNHEGAWTPSVGPVIVTVVNDLFSEHSGRSYTELNG